jgi:transposase
MTASTGVKREASTLPRPARWTLPDNLPVEPPPCACGKCDGIRLRKLGEVVSKTLECTPRRLKVVERVREKLDSVCSHVT